MQPSTDPEGKPLAVTIKRACRLIGVGNTMMYQLMREGRVRTVNVGRRRLVLYGSLEALLGAPAPPKRRGRPPKIRPAEPAA